MASQILRALFLAALALATVAAQKATAQLTDPQDNCTTNNCKSRTFQAAYRLDQFNRAVPFVIQIFSSGGECVRVAVTKETSDLETVLVAPNGTFWRNDDGGTTCSLCPVVKAITPQLGWYTLQISHFDAGGATGNFTAKYGRYPSGNPNCNNPTAPLLGASPGAPK